MRASVDRFLRGVHLTAPRMVKGTMSAFGYDYLTANYKGPAIRLNPEYQYEALNLWDGKRTDAEIRDLLSAIYEPVALEDVSQFLSAVASIGVLPPRKP